MGKFIKVIFTSQFKLWLKNYPKADQMKIGLFVEHVKQFGLNNLQGRNKSSDNVPTDDLNWLQKVKYTQAYRLWHYHIGIPDYAGEFGDRLANTFCIISVLMMRLSSWICPPTHLLNYLA